MNTKSEFLGEFLGTFLLAIFGCGSVAVSVLYNSFQGLFQIGMVWGIGVMLAIYATRHLSNAHLNPAVSLTMVACKRMSVKKLPVYLLAQFLGAFIGGLFIYLIFNQSILGYENSHQIVRGTPESMNVAKMFGEYYHLNGSAFATTMTVAFLAEAFGTFLLVLLIFVLTEEANEGRPNSNLAPVFIGLTVTSIISLLAPLTQAGLNPARDFGPRLVTLIFGWGMAAFPDNSGGFFWVYMIAPIFGGLSAGLFYTRIIEPAMNQKTINHNIERRCAMKTRVILVGGFLGAGKTTLLWEAAKKLSEKGHRVGLITNDQAENLVDTAFLEYSGTTVSEVNGSCFCCNFEGFKDAIISLKEKNKADIIIAEPVGSCTDLSATIIQPVKEKYSDIIIISPLTVLVDPEKLQAILDGGTAGLHISAAYILQKQLEEADIIVITKTDILSLKQLDKLIGQTTKHWPSTKVLSISSKNGDGIEYLLNEMMTMQTAGTHLAEVDYDVYAQGEAVLGWLNATVKLNGNSINWDKVAENILTELSDRFESKEAAVGHVKLMVESKKGFLVGNLTGKKCSLVKRGSAGISNDAKLTLNARVEMTPEDLDSILAEVLHKVCGEEINNEVNSLKCLSPGRPDPTYRYNYVVV